MATHVKRTPAEKAALRAALVGAAPTALHTPTGALVVRTMGGTLPVYLRQALEATNPKGMTAEELQWEVVRILQSYGWGTTLEYHVEYKRNNRTVGGRIDILACKGSHTLAIEIDRHSPRKKSISKLLACKPFTTAQAIIVRLNG